MEFHYFLKILEQARQAGGRRWAADFAGEMWLNSDTFLTERFKEDGFNLLGRATCPEFAFSTATELLLNGLTRNPWDLGKSTGGSVEVLQQVSLPGSCRSRMPPMD